MSRRRPPTLSGLSIAEILRRWPQSVGALSRAGLGCCVGCAMASFESLAEASRVLGLEPSRVARSLSEAILEESP